MGNVTALQAVDTETLPPPVEAEQRRYRRYAVLLAGKFHRGKTSVDCVILDLSPLGAKLRLSEPLADDAIGTLESDRFGMIPGEVVWSKDESAGIRFLDQPAWIAGLLSMVLPLTKFETDPV
ncbi:MAG: hypothetical protein GVY13_01210 [Alphaproteobacteria bacterium]|jgi:hypothetical protein|nr:hypothetical protein [Alphaproteobacteria bacterium]